MSKTVNMTPTPDAFASLGGAILYDVVRKVPATEQFAVAQMLESVIDIARYLAVVDSKQGTQHIAALLKRAVLYPVPPTITEGTAHD